ncbi:MAG: hypothetical protein ACPGWR_27550 [Ardenticatenaceae bacterium]
MVFQKIPLYLPPPTIGEIGAAYVRLVLGLSPHVPGLLNAYLGPSESLDMVLAAPPDLLRLRHDAVSVATAVQKAELPHNRRNRLLRRVRAVLWLIRAALGERIMFTEQVRMLLDLKPEHIGDKVFQAAHNALSEALPGEGALASRWQSWQATYTVPAMTALPLLLEAVESLKQGLGVFEAKDLTQGDIQVVAVEGDGEPFYQQGQLSVPQEATLRVDRLYHLAARLGYGGTHTVYSAMAERYAAGEAECAVLLNLGPDQVLAQGLSHALLPELDLYHRPIPALLQRAGLPAIEPAALQAIHAAEDALQWSKANAALLLHGQKLRPRAVRRHLVANALMTRQQADTLLQEVADPVRAAHAFAPLIGGPLIKTWLAKPHHTLSTLLTDPPVPSSMVFEIRVAN